MIQLLTVSPISDNSGGLNGQCIKMLRGIRKRSSKIGDTIMISVKKARPRTKTKKGEISPAIVVRIRKKISRKDGTYLSFDNRGIILINSLKKKDNTKKKKTDIILKGTRVNGPIPLELRNQKTLKIVSLAKTII